MSEKIKKLYHNVIDLTDHTYGRLNVLEFSHSNRNGAYWICKCSCGVIKTISGGALRHKTLSKRTVSCGCYCKENNQKLGKARVGESSPAWKADRENLHKLQKARKFIYKQLQNLKNADLGGSRSFEKLGYKPKDLAAHLEKQFDVNMNWKNYGTYWVIDHKIPIAHFIKQGIMEPKIINALNNLQPMEKIANIKKSNKLGV